MSNLFKILAPLIFKLYSADNSGTKLLQHCCCKHAHYANGATIYNTMYPKDGTQDSLLDTTRTTRLVPVVTAVPAHGGIAEQPAVAEHEVVDIT